MQLSNQRLKKVHKYSIVCCSTLKKQFVDNG